MWSQIFVRSNSDNADLPAEIALNRQVKSGYLATAYGVAGNTARGAFWWAGGHDRINIDCESGRVRIAVALDTPSMRSNVIKSLTNTTVRIENNVVITGDLSCNGIVTNNPFWIAGKVASNGTSVVSLGRYTFTCSTQATGQYTITCGAITPFPDTNYVVQLTCQADGANATARVVNASVATSGFNVFTHLNSVSAACAFHFIVLV